MGIEKKRFAFAPGAFAPGIRQELARWRNACKETSSSMAVAHGKIGTEKHDGDEIRR